ncbi:MAG: CocE/NonD family hydrolase [Candidatus Heimdallarchaeota archaeon]|nr:CocE/NonD family hydrolase [Candidatus Heimdallarchaeota archaeon]MCK4771203.1 CocE/NonD family hydrolase [Candidatus Heimdallarchaeota archaeon]
MNRKILVSIISAVIISAIAIPLMVVYIPDRPPIISGFEWQFPSNSTVREGYVIVPYLVSMRDNVKISTDIYVPIAIDEPLPVIFIRTPYGKSQLALMAIGYALKNYIVVLQDFRGFYESEGALNLPFISEQLDGQDSLEWITEQEWCNGRIGTWGPSALGIAQYLMAPNAPSSLKCQLPMVATPDIYEAMFRGGELRHELILPWLEGNGFPDESLETLQEYEKLNDIWDQGRIVDNYSQIQAASLHLGGWYDILTQETINAFLGYQYSGGVNASGNAKLVMGPWVHGGMLGEPSGNITYQKQNPGITLNVADALFEKWLRHNSTLWDLYPTVAFYLMSSYEYNSDILANDWYQSDLWPLSTTNLDLYMHSNESILHGISAYSQDLLSYEYDPNDPVETIYGGNLALPAGTWDQQSLESRDDVLVFTTPTLTEPLTIVGQITTTLYIESNCTDTDFTVKLTDVYPDGRSMLITDTIIRARNRFGYEDWNFLDEGIVYELSIPLDSTAYLFNEGHRLRIDISSSNFPRFETNPNTGDVLWGNDTTFIANNSIHVSSTYPSKISIPTVEYNSLTPFSFDLNPTLKTSKQSFRENQYPAPLTIGWIKSILIVQMLLKRMNVDKII